MGHNQQPKGGGCAGEQGNRSYAGGGNGGGNKKTVDAATALGLGVPQQNTMLSGCSAALLAVAPAAQLPWLPSLQCCPVGCHTLGLAYRAPWAATPIHSAAPSAASARVQCSLIDCSHPCSAASQLTPLHRGPTGCGTSRVAPWLPRLQRSPPVCQTCGTASRLPHLQHRYSTGPSAASVAHAVQPFGCHHCSAALHTSHILHGPRSRALAAFSTWSPLRGTGGLSLSCAHQPFHRSREFC